MTGKQRTYAEISHQHSTLLFIIFMKEKKNMHMDTKVGNIEWRDTKFS